jgi:hypothetical protein
MRRATPLLRATRAIVGLVTIWCLGCSGYEPLLGSLLGSRTSAMMACDGQAPTSAPSVSAVPDSHGFDCGCGSCHAASAVQWRVDYSPPTLAAIVQPEPTEPAFIARVPLLPPPEFSA